MKIAFYFDPSCPWCWVTSRWILKCSNKREINIDWRLFSLAYKNGDLKNEKSEVKHMPSHRIERVMLAATKQGVNMIDLYTSFGIKHFIGGEEYNNGLIISVLDQLKLNKQLINFADDRSLDKELISSSKSAVDIVGQDIGVPTIVFIYEDKKQVGFFGPVLKDLPDQTESLKVWDNLVELAKQDSFYELKRGRNGGPDVFSTAKC